MNIRAADAIVSSAPKPMKIFPIRDVWSQVELSLVIVTAAVAGGVLAGAAVGLAASVPAVVGLPSCSVLSTSLSWSAATMKVRPSAVALAELSDRAAGTSVPDGMTAAALSCTPASSICALALAIDGGMLEETLLSADAGVASGAVLSASLSSAFVAIAWDLRCT